MKIKNNVNYFTKGDSLKFVGAAMVALAFLLYFVGWGWISWILICTFFPVGAVLFIVGSSGRSGDDDIDEYIAVKTRELDPNLDLNKDYAQRIMKYSEAVEIEGYEFRDGLMYTKTKKGVVRSSEFTKTVIYTLTDALHITSRTVPLTTDEERADRVLELPYEDIVRAELSEEQRRFVFNKKSFSVKELRFCVVMANGETVSMPIHDDLRSEQLVENVNRILENYRKSK